jgi:hypothetical protein
MGHNRKIVPLLLSKSEREAKPVQKVKMGSDISERQKRVEVSPICSILPKVIKTDNKTSREATAIADGRATTTDLRH